MKKQIVVIAIVAIVVIAFVVGMKFAGKNNENESEQSLRSTSEPKKTESLTDGQVEQEVSDNKEMKNRTIKLFYYDGTKDNDQCTEKGLVSVERTVLDSENIIEDTMNLFFAGELTAQERAAGIGTEFPLDGFKLIKTYFSEREEKLLLIVDDPKFSAGGGSCRTGILYYQLEATAKQFPEVNYVQVFPLHGEPFVP